MARDKKYPQDGTRIIKRYRNRKLYDTVASKYINIDSLLEMPENSFTVIDSDSGKVMTDDILISALADFYSNNHEVFALVKSDLIGKVKKIKEEKTL